jgi:hypothetical protein
LQSLESTQMQTRCRPEAAAEAEGTRSGGDLEEVEVV